MLLVFFNFQYFFFSPASGDSPDFDAVAVSLTFNASVSRINVTVKINDDDIDEVDEQFSADLQRENDRVDLSPDKADVLILDNDGEISLMNALRGYYYAV